MEWCCRCRKRKQMLLLLILYHHFHKVELLRSLNSGKKNTKRKATQTFFKYASNRMPSCISNAKKWSLNDIAVMLDFIKEKQAASHLHGALYKWKKQIFIAIQNRLKSNPKTQVHHWFQVRQMWISLRKKYLECQDLRNSSNIKPRWPLYTEIGALLKTPEANVSVQNTVTNSVVHPPGNAVSINYGMESMQHYDKRYLHKNTWSASSAGSATVSQSSNLFKATKLYSSLASATAPSSFKSVVCVKEEVAAEGKDAFPSPLISQVKSIASADGNTLDDSNRSVADSSNNISDGSQGKTSTLSSSTQKIIAGVGNLSATKTDNDWFARLISDELHKLPPGIQSDVKGKIWNVVFNSLTSTEAKTP